MLIRQTENFQREAGYKFNEVLVQVEDFHLLFQGSQNSLDRIFSFKTADHM